MLEAERAQLLPCVNVRWHSQLLHQFHILQQVETEVQEYCCTKVELVVRHVRCLDLEQLCLAVFVQKLPWNMLYHAWTLSKGYHHPNLHFELFSIFLRVWLCMNVWRRSLSAWHSSCTGSSFRSSSRKWSKRIWMNLDQSKFLSLLVSMKEKKKTKKNLTTEKHSCNPPLGKEKY